MTDIATSQAPARRLGFPQSRNGVLLALTACQTASALAICLVLGQPFAISTLSVLVMLGTTLFPTFLLVVLGAYFLRLAVHVRPDRPIQHFVRDIRAVMLDWDRLRIGLIALLAMTIFTGFFSLNKSHITLLQPFTWDTAFAQLDRLLHFGNDPYVLLQPLLGTPLATSIINAAYHFWFFLMYFLLFMACFDKNDVAHSGAYLIALILCFALGGNLLATVFSSAGPVYYAEFGFGQDFVPLMDMLNRFHEVSPVWALNVQDMLLAGHYGEGPVKGISAMPSMHVASTVIITAYAFTWQRWAGWLMVGFTALIMLGSVHLGWHYAIDGYFGALLALVCWWIATRVSRPAKPLR